MKRLARNSVIAVLVTSVGVAGCVTTNTSPSQTGGSASTADDGCNVGIFALAGAVAGGLLAKGNDRLKGAALGAGIASLACAAWNYNVKQTKTAEQVQTEYKTVNAGRLPTESKVTSFTTKFEPNGNVKPGGRMVAVSNIEVVQGTDGVKPVIEEELTLVKPDGTEQKSPKKIANEASGGGAFQTTFSMNMPQGVPQGIYPVKTALYVNGKPAGTNKLSMQVVANPDGTMIALLY